MHILYASYMCHTYYAIHTRNNIQNKHNLPWGHSSSTSTGLRDLRETYIDIWRGKAGRHSVRSLQAVLMIGFSTNNTYVVSHCTLMPPCVSRSRSQDIFVLVWLLEHWSLLLSRVNRWIFKPVHFSGMRVRTYSNLLAAAMLWVWKSSARHSTAITT